MGDPEQSHKKATAKAIENHRDPSGIHGKLQDNHRNPKDPPKQTHKKTQETNRKPQATIGTQYYCHFYIICCLDWSCFKPIPNIQNADAMFDAEIA